MSWGLELWDRVDAVIGQITEDTDELGGVFTRWVIGNILVLMVKDTDELASVFTRWFIGVKLVLVFVLVMKFFDQYWRV